MTTVIIPHFLSVPRFLGRPRLLTRLERLPSCQSSIRPHDIGTTTWPVSACSINVSVTQSVRISCGVI